MKNVQVMDCSQSAGAASASGTLERVNYFNRQLLTAEDMTTAADYFLEKLRRHNRFLHGWGVVCGLGVTAAPIAGSPWRVQIGSGYALSPNGDEVFVGEAVCFDLEACLTGGSSNPCEPGMVTPGHGGTSSVAYLAIRYAECLSRPVKTASSGCGCDDDPCQYSRIRDSFQLQCLSKLPPKPKPPADLCQVVNGGVIAPCPPCPTDPWIVLAKILLPSSTNMNITNDNIDNSVRRVIVSSAVLQDQIVRCCCGTTSTSSSSSTTSSTGNFVTSRIRSAFGSTTPGVLTVGQRAKPVPGAERSTQISATVLNSSGTLAKDVVLTVSLSPALPAKQFTVKPSDGWKTSGLKQLVSKPVTLEPGKATTLSFEIVPGPNATAISVTSFIHVATAAPDLAGDARPIQATVGG